MKLHSPGIHFVHLLLLALLLSGSWRLLAQEPEATPITDERLAEIIQRLENTPVFTNFDTARVHEIFAAGQALGNRANVFAMVGDSNTTNGDFMRPIGVPNSECVLGPYQPLQATIDHFSVPPTANDENSFTRSRDSFAAVEGLAAATALDPFWSRRGCRSRETPLACEFRHAQPSVALIMLGQIDINYMESPPETYRANMTAIIEETIAHGVIPVLSTIVFLPEREDVWPVSMVYNDIILDLAEQYEVPLINLWLAVQPLPRVGIGPDNSHLKAEVGRYCDFSGAEQELGGTLRNLLNLQALDQLRINVLTAN